MLIKAAITGTHGTGKTTMTDLVIEKAHRAGWNVLVVYSTTREVLKLGKRYGLGNNKDGDFRFQLTNTMAIQLRQWEIEAEAERIANVTMLPTLVVGDRCLLDPLSYTKDLFNRADEARRLKESVVERVLARDDVNRLWATYDLTRDIAKADVNQYWDLVCYKPPHPDHLEADADRLDDRQYQADVDKIVREHFHELVTSDRQRQLDPDLHVAADQLWDAVRSLADDSGFQP